MSRMLTADERHVLITALRRATTVYLETAQDCDKAIQECNNPDTSPVEPTIAAQFRTLQLKMELWSITVNYLIKDLERAVDIELHFIGSGEIDSARDEDVPEPSERLQEADELAALEAAEPVGTLPV